jgi:FtsZ-binding cell division protein ZapB
MADTDSGQDVEETAEDSTVNPQMGDGLFEDVSTPAVGNSDDISSSAQDATTGHSEEVAVSDSSRNQSDFNPSAVDLLRVNVEEVPENYRSLAQNAQNALRQMQSGFTQSQQEMSERVRQLEQGNGSAQETVAETIKQLSQPDEFAHLTPEQQQAIDTVKSIIGTETQELRDQIQSMSGIQATVQQLYEAQESQRKNALQQEVNEARALYGNDLDGYGTQIKALMGTANPRTGYRYTVRDAYELLSGKTQAQSQSMQQAQNQVYNGAKNSINTASATSNGMPQGSGDLSQADALAGLKGLGFE